MTGSAREAQKLHEETGAALYDYSIGRKDREIMRKRTVLEAKISSLRTEFESVEEELNKAYEEEALRSEIRDKTHKEITQIRRNSGSNPTKE